jgi:hypothetical protein
MKVIIPTENINAGKGADTTTYENSLTFDQFVAGRSALIQTIARYLKPDYLILQSEPDTEAGSLPARLGNQITNAAADMLMIANFLSDRQSAGLRSTNTIVGAGCGTDQNDFTNFLTGFTNLAGLDRNEMRVGIGEYWRSRRPTRNSARPNAGLRPILDQYEDLGPDRSAVTEYQSGTGLSGAGGWSANSHCPWLLRIHSTRSSCAADNEQRT